MKKLLALSVLAAGLSMQAQSDPPAPCITTIQVTYTYYAPVYVFGYGYVMIPLQGTMWIDKPGYTTPSGACLPYQ